MSTNGLLLNIDKVKSIVPYVDQLIINNYCLDMKMHENIQVIHAYVKEHPEEFKDVDILIQTSVCFSVSAAFPSFPLRPPHPAQINNMKTSIHARTLLFFRITRLPFFEVTDLADLNKVPLKDGWNSEKYQKLRDAVKDPLIAPFL